MSRMIAFLRAINVGKRIVKMDVLRQIFEVMGFADVETFIASGNVVFDVEDMLPHALEKLIEANLREALGYEVTTFIRTGAEVAEIAGYLPFLPVEMEAARALDVAFLGSKLDESSQVKMMALRTAVDDFHVHNREVYWLRRKDQGESTFSGGLLEKTLGMRATIRRMNTVKRIAVKYLPPG